MTIYFFPVSPLQRSGWFLETWWNLHQVPACRSSHNNPERGNWSVWMKDDEQQQKVRNYFRYKKGNYKKEKSDIKQPDSFSVIAKRLRSGSDLQTVSGCNWLSLTVTGLVSTSLMYSATGIGPVAFILEVRCRSMECRGFSSPVGGLQKSLVPAARHRPVKHKHYKYIFLVIKTFSCMI